MSMQLTGGCLCGAVRYEVIDEPELTLFCHCTQCQKASGAPFSAEIIVERTGVNVEGDMTSYLSTADSGSTVTRKFCPVCGSTILIEFEREDYRDVVALTIGTLDDAASLTPDGHFFTTSKQPWIQICDDLPHFVSDAQHSD